MKWVESRRQKDATRERETEDHHVAKRAPPPHDRFPASLSPHWASPPPLPPTRTRQREKRETGRPVALLVLAHERDSPPPLSLSLPLPLPSFPASFQQRKQLARHALVDAGPHVKVLARAVGVRLALDPLGAGLRGRERERGSRAVRAGAEVEKAVAKKKKSACACSRVPLYSHSPHPVQAGVHRPAAHALQARGWQSVWHDKQFCPRPSPPWAPNRAAAHRRVAQHRGGARGAPRPHTFSPRGS